MINLIAHTYQLDNAKIKKDLKRLWTNYTKIINQKNPTWDEANKARAILYLTGQLYCEQVAVSAIERRLHLLKTKLSLLDFFTIIDGKSPRLPELRQDKMFTDLEKFYLIIKDFKNHYVNGKYYLEEEKFLRAYKKANPDKKNQIGYRGSFKKHS